MTFNIQEISLDVGGKTLSFKTGHMARQAAGSLTVRLGDTIVFAAAAAGGPSRYDDGGVALTVDYREFTYAAGKIPGGFFKREGRPTTREILTSRLIDRPCRPLFPDEYKNEVSLNTVVLSFDQENDPNVLAMNASSAALMLSGVPFNGPVGAVRVAYVDGQYILFPTLEQLENSLLDITVAGTKKGVTMVESGAKEVGEEVALGAIEAGHKEIVRICRAIEDLVAKAGKPRTWTAPEAKASDIYDRIKAGYAAKIREAHYTKIKHERGEKLGAVKEAIMAEFFDEEAEEPKYSKGQIGDAYTKLLSQTIRQGVLEGKRADGRGMEDIRPIHIEVGVLPRTHGSSLFTRGETQALATVTLGVGRDAQLIDGLEPSYDKTFFLHYNFPAYCVGEAWPNRGPKRREIGHGALAERALQGVLPAPEDFPYVIRVVSDVMESNGSSSMASVCGGSLALMDAGVPLKAPVAGIAMGLVTEGGKVAVLSDILGSEDHDGDMDFKVAGTANGITALQMDIKIDNISIDTMRKALEQARKGRLKILDNMAAVISKSRGELSTYAPRLERISIDPEKIGMVIGPGGRNIRALQEETSTEINIEDDGTVLIAGLDSALVNRAKTIILDMTRDIEAEQEFNGRVVGIRDFGAFIELIPGREGLLHVSEISHDYVQDVKSVLKMGDQVRVKVLSVDPEGKIRLSAKALMEAPPDSERKKREDGPGGKPSRGGDRNHDRSHGKMKR